MEVYWREGGDGQFVIAPYSRAGINQPPSKMVGSTEERKKNLVKATEKFNFKKGIAQRRRSSPTTPRA